MMVDAVHEESRSLLTRVASGDAAATRDLLDLTGPAVYGFIYARVGGRADTAEDLTQATYLEAMRSWAGYRGDAALATWLCAIARRQVARNFESERRRLRIERELRLVTTEAPPESDESDLYAEGDAIIAALGVLSPLHRQVLVLKYLDALSVDEIATELKRSKVQIQSLLQRARAGLRRALEEGDRD
jgi:RNA polymerase sigma factor (sigma-70 family)